MVILTENAFESGRKVYFERFRLLRMHKIYGKNFKTKF